MKPITDSVQTKPSAMRRPFAAALATVFASLFLGALALAGVPHRGETAPAFSLPKAAGGGNITLASLRGKPVYLNFFANWCAPCNEEAPSIVELYEKYHRRGLITLGVDELESAKRALEFANKYRYPFPVVLDDGKMGKNYGVLAMPVHVYIDRAGKISTYRLGEMNPSEIEAAIKKIL